MAKRKKPAAETKKPARESKKPAAESRFRTPSTPTSDTLDDASVGASAVESRPEPAAVTSPAPEAQRSTVEAEGVTSGTLPTAAAAAQVPPTSDPAAPETDAGQAPDSSQAGEPVPAADPVPAAEPAPAAEPVLAADPLPAEPSDESTLGTTQAEAAADAVDWRDRISARAYKLYEERGSSHGGDLADWLEAERQIVRPADRPTDE